MADSKFDLVSERKKFGEAMGIDSEFTEEDFVRKISVYDVLTFEPNQKKPGLISFHNETAVFLDWNSDQTVMAGDTWLCKLRLQDRVYYAMPILKITPVILMGFSTELCNSIVDALWQKNRKDYESIFESRYKETMYARISEEMASERENEIESLKQRITELERDLDASRFAIDAASGMDSIRDEIELSSDPIPVNAKAKEAPQEPIQNMIAPVEDERPQSFESFVQRPPERAFASSVVEMMAPARNVTVSVQHVSDKLLYSESFPNGKYFVHVSPNQKFMLIRADSEGPVYCVNHHIMLNDLGKIIPFKEESVLKAEFSPKYRGILIHLGI